MMNVQNLGSKESLQVKFNDGICAELCLKLWFESNWYFCNIAESECFWKQPCRNKVQKNHFLKSVWKSNIAEVNCRTLDMQGSSLYQISDYKRNIHLYGKLSTKLLAQTANKYNSFMFTKTGRLLNLKYGFRKDCQEKF